MSASRAHTQAQLLTDLERRALLAAHDAPNRTLRRFGNGFLAVPVHRAHSGTVQSHNVTKRMALRLHRYQLLRLDSEACPSTLTITAAGMALVQALRTAANEDEP